jgi:hypothetical protein
MGGEAEAGDWVLSAESPLPARLRLLRDGEQVKMVEGSELSHRAHGPGVYRVEALRHAHGAERTWVISNPIYLR